MPDNELDPLSKWHATSTWISSRPGYRWARGRRVPGGPYDYGNSASEADRERRDAAEDTWLVDDLPVAGFRHHSIEEHPGLFHDFLSLRTTQRSLLGFANAYGMLGAKARYVEVEGRTGPTPGEPLWQWKRTLLWMQQGRDLWKLADEGSDSELQSRLQLKDLRHPTLDIQSATYSQRISGQTFRVGASVYGSPSLSDAARFIVQEVINDHLEASTSYSMVYNHRTGAFENHIQTQGLLGALWFQFAESLDPNRSYPLCPGCGKRFRVSPDTKRSDSKYCSEKCCARAYRRRRKKARELRGQGVSIREIAQQVGSTPKTVRGWLR